MFHNASNIRSHLVVLYVIHNISNNVHLLVHVFPTIKTLNWIVQMLQIMNLKIFECYIMVAVDIW
jgi:hypothetical protein